jgi:hypothetical protein
MTRLLPSIAALLLHEGSAVAVDVDMMRAVGSIISARVELPQKCKRRQGCAKVILGGGITNENMWIIKKVIRRSRPPAMPVTAPDGQSATLRLVSSVLLYGLKTLKDLSRARDWAVGGQCPCWSGIQCIGLGLGWFWFWLRSEIHVIDFPFFPFAPVFFSDSTLSVASCK